MVIAPFKIGPSRTSSFGQFQTALVILGEL